MSIITETLGNICLDEPLAYRKLTVFPLTRPVDGPPEYLTLDQAMADSSIKIGEVSESGNVPEIRFENTGSKPTLLVDGEEISGGKHKKVPDVPVLIRPVRPVRRYARYARYTGTPVRPVHPVSRRYAFIPTP